MSKISSKLYPLARRDEAIVDNFHGTQVKDTYRWLEDPDSPETNDFVTKLNAVSMPFINAAPHKQKIADRLKVLWDFPKLSCPSKRGSHYYYRYNTGLQNQSVLYKLKDLNAEREVFIDPNKLSEDGTTALGLTQFTTDGSLMAYGLQEKGSDWVTLKVKKAPSGEDLTDVLTKLRYTSVAWTGNVGFFYSMFPKHSGQAVGSATDKNEFHSLYYHKLGTPQSDDVLCVDFPKNKEYMIGASVTEDGRYLEVGVNRGCDPTNMLYYYDLQAVNNNIDGKLNLVPLIDTFTAKYDLIENEGTKFIIQTNKDAPMFKLVTVDVAKKPLEWKELIPENEKNKLDWATVVAGNKLILCYNEDVKSTLYVHDLATGKFIYQIPIEIGDIDGFFGRKILKEVLFSFTSFLTPGTVYRLDFSEEKPLPKEYKRIEMKGFKPEDYETKQVFYNSKDGTKVPMYIVHKKGVVYNGENPCMLYGYGGFNISLMPAFSISRILWLDNFQGVYAVANLRGGSEYGEKWHEGGMKANKQNVFDDFIAAAECLITMKVTKKQRLCIQGGSNGGLLVAACAQQRPELFGAVINRVGVMDMLRYHKFTIGEAWAPEFGCADNAEDFKYLIKYSPLHNLYTPKEEKQEYPCTLLMTADHDDRVVPLHSLKYIAQLYQCVKDCEKQMNPLIIRVEVKAGHGHGKPTSKVIEELVDLYAFLDRVLDMQWKE